MIHYFDKYLMNDSYFFNRPEEFIGKYIFKNNGSIGDFLGTITKINGPNRIFYHNELVDKDGYLSCRTIGLMCDNYDDVEKLLNIKKTIAEKRKNFQQELNAYRDKELVKIIEGYRPNQEDNIFVLSL